MLLDGLRIGFGFTGAYCVFDQVFPELQRVVNEGADVISIVSYQVATTDSRYGDAKDFLMKMEAITGLEPIQTIPHAEILNKQTEPLDALVIAPCTGNSLSKLADGATDTPVLMMAKELFRNNKPVILGIATNDGLGISAKSIAALLCTKNVYFVPFGQDNPIQKPSSLVAKFDETVPTIIASLRKEQLQPVLISF